MALGYSHDAFWDQTYCSLLLTYQAAAERRDREHNARAWLAYHIAALTRTDKMPRYETLLAKPKTVINLDKQIADLKSWVIATGGKVVVRSKDGMN